MLCQTTGELLKINLLQTAFQSYQKISELLWEAMGGFRSQMCFKESLDCSSEYLLLFQITGLLPEVNLIPRAFQSYVEISKMLLEVL